VCVREDHLGISQLSGGSTGVSMCPQILTTPSKRPMKSSEEVSGGTSLAMERCLFLIRTGSLVARTSSMTVRHGSLNFRAGIFLIACFLCPRWYLNGHTRKSKLSKAPRVHVELVTWFQVFGNCSCSDGRFDAAAEQVITLQCSDWNLRTCRPL